MECAHKYDNFTLPDLMPMEAYRDEIKSEIVLNLSDNEITHVPDDYVSCELPNQYLISIQI